MPFTPFGADHLTALAITAATAWALSRLVRRAPDGEVARAVRVAVAAYLIIATAAVMLLGSGGEPFRILDVLPLHLCDLAIFIAAYTLIVRAQATFELLYFWALTGTLLAMLTPDLERGFPDLACISFFGIHGGVLTAALLLTWGFGMRPRRGAAWKAFLFTNAYAALVGIVDLLANTNYMYLHAKPTTPTLLDWLGPWPWYILAADALALGLFTLLAIPFHGRHENENGRRVRG